MIRTELSLVRGQAKTWCMTFCPPQNIAGMNFIMNIRQYYNGPLLVRLTGTIIDAANGVYSCTITAAQSLLAPGPYYWDTWRTDSGDEDPLGSGPMTVKESYWN